MSATFPYATIEAYRAAVNIALTEQLRPPIGGEAEEALAASSFQHAISAIGCARQILEERLDDEDEKGGD